MAVTSVAGHILRFEFVEPFNDNWRICEPRDLFHLNVHKILCGEDKKGIIDSLKAEARQSDWIVLWLDCDREGENISFEVLSVCLEENPRLRINRAFFSSITPFELRRAGI
jgi:DNA topoisomerase-3